MNLSQQKNNTYPKNKYWYTIAETDYEDDTPIIMFNSVPETREEVLKRAIQIRNLNLEVPFVLCRTAKDEDTWAATPYYHYLLKLLSDRALYEPLAVVDEDGDIYVGTVYDVFKTCTLPWRISVDCSDCQTTDTNNVFGNPCVVIGADNHETWMRIYPDICAEDVYDKLRQFKPSMGNSSWLSPAYTQAETAEIKPRYSRYTHTKRTNRVFAPNLRPIDDHDFDPIEVEENYDRRQEAAKNAANTRKIQRTQCSKCVFLRSCQSFHYGQTKHYISRCNYFTPCRKEQLVEHYIEPYKHIDRRELTYVLRNTGVLSERVKRKLAVLHVELYHGEYNITVKPLYPHHGYSRALQLKTLSEAVQFLRSRNDPPYYSTTTEGLISDETLALYVLACQYRQPKEVNSYHGTFSHDVLYLSTRGGSVKIHYQYSKGEYYYGLYFDDICDGFKHFGHQEVPYNLRPV